MTMMIRPAVRVVASHSVSATHNGHCHLPTLLSLCHLCLAPHPLNHRIRNAVTRLLEHHVLSRDLLHHKGREEMWRSFQQANLAKSECIRPFVPITFRDVEMMPKTPSKTGAVVGVPIDSKLCTRCDTPRVTIRWRSTGHYLRLRPAHIARPRDLHCLRSRNWIQYTRKSSQTISPHLCPYTPCPPPPLLLEVKSTFPPHRLRSRPWCVQ
jgi:hypothetical protein